MAAAADGASKPTFPPNQPPGYAALGKFSSILNDPGSEYCGEAVKAETLTPQVTGASTKMRLIQEVGFSKRVCANSKFVGLSGHK